MKFESRYYISGDEDLAMATHGSVGEFNDTVEDWTSYTERLEQYFAANDVASAAKQRAILLSGCGAPTYRILRSLVAPDKPTDKTYQDLVKLLKDHFSPKPSVIVQRFNFNSRSRKAGESVAQYVAELRRLTEFCEFSSATINDMLRDRFVCGIKDARIQRRLLAEKDLTFKSAYEAAIAMESADRDVQDLHKPLADGCVHALSRASAVDSNSSPLAPPGYPCHRCGGRHLASSCRFRDADCRRCGKRGHIARVCRSKPKEQHSPGRETARPTDRRTNVLEDVEEEPENQDTVYPASLFCLSGRTTDPLRETVQINQVDVSMEVDTGASLSVISEETYKASWSLERRPPLRPSGAGLRTYTGEELEVLGRVVVSVSYRGQQKELSLLVVRGSGPSLLGRDWLAELRLDWKELHRVHMAPRRRLQTVLENHPDVFRDELGTLKDVQATIHVEPKAQPTFCRPRPVI